jgi:hypothetical protein
MKSILVLLWLACLVVSGQAAGGVSAKTALRTWSNATSPAVVSRLVYVFGPHGQDQPQSWLFVTKDEAGYFQEHRVNGKSYAGVRAVPGFGVGKAIAAKRWKIDSTTAFVAADKAAKASKRGFDYANLEMRCTELSDRPVWFVTLVNARDLKVAEVSVSAETGGVLTKNFYVPQDAKQPELPKAKGKKRGAPPQGPGPGMMPPPQPYQPGQTQYYNPNQPAPQMQPQPQPKARTGLLDNARDGLENSGRTIRGWFNKLTGQGQAPAPQQPYYTQPVR